MDGNTRVLRLDDPLGHLVPPGSLTRAQLHRELFDVMVQARSALGPTPTHYVVCMHPADRAWLDPETEDGLALALQDYARRAGYERSSTPFEVRFQVDDRCAPGRPNITVHAPAHAADLAQTRAL